MCCLVENESCTNIVQIPLYSYNHKTAMSRDEKVGGAGLERGALNLNKLYETALSQRKIEKIQQNQLHASEAFQLQVDVAVQSKVCFNCCRSSYEGALGHFQKFPCLLGARVPKHPYHWEFFKPFCLSVFRDWLTEIRHFFHRKDYCWARF